MFFGDKLGITVAALDPAAKEIVKKYPDAELEQVLELYAQIYSNQKYCNSVRSSPSAALFFGYTENDENERDRDNIESENDFEDDDDDTMYDGYNSYETGDYKEKHSDENYSEESEENEEQGVAGKTFCREFAAADKKTTKSLLNKYKSLADLKSENLDVGLFNRIPKKYYYYILLSNEYLATLLQTGVSDVEQTTIFDILIDKNERFIRYFVFRRCRNNAAKIMEDCVQECKMEIISDLGNCSVDFSKIKFTTYMSRHIMTAIDYAKAKHHGYTLNYSRENTKFHKLCTQLRESGVSEDDMDDAILDHTGWKRQRLQSMKNIAASAAVVSFDSDDYTRLSDRHADVEETAFNRVLIADMRAAMIKMREDLGPDGWTISRVMLDVSDNCSEASIAKRYNITPADVKKYLSTARDYLRNCPMLAQYKPEHETILSPTYGIFHYIFSESAAVAEYADEIADSICEEVGLLPEKNENHEEQKAEKHSNRYYDEELDEEFEMIVDEEDDSYEFFNNDEDITPEIGEDDEISNNLLVANICEA